jgi:methionyl-tRNA formyltransferase
MTLRVGFAGTPIFAASALAAIADAGFSVPLVLTRPDRPKGRGLHVEASPAKAEALRRGLPLLQPPTLKSEEAREEALGVPLDVLVVAAYGLILPPAVLRWPRSGCINIHASLLPRWRGAAPIERAIEAGDVQTGITIMQMDEGLDTGPMLERVAIAIDPRETAGTLHDKLASAGTRAIVDVLRRLERDGALAATPQTAEGATYAARIGRDEARIAWDADARAIDRRIRAFDPAPGAFGLLDGGLVKIWRAEPFETGAAEAPGTIVRAGPSGIDVATGNGLVRILELQPAGSRRMAAAAAVAGRLVRPGTRFAA